MGAITGQKSNIPGALKKELERGPKEIRSAFLCSFQLSLPDPLPDGHSRYRHGAYQVMPQTYQCKIAKWTQSSLLCNEQTVCSNLCFFKETRSFYCLPSHKIGCSKWHLPHQLGLVAIAILLYISNGQLKFPKWKLDPTNFTF